LWQKIAIINIELFCNKEKFVAIIVPIRDKVVVKKIEDDARTKSGLVIPDGSVERPTTGEVIAVGEGKLTDDGKVLPMVVKAGDIIIYPKYSGFPIKVDNEEFLILKEEEILGFLRKGDTDVK